MSQSDQLIEIECAVEAQLCMGPATVREIAGALHFPATGLVYVALGELQKLGIVDIEVRAGELYWRLAEAS